MDRALKIGLTLVPAFLGVALVAVARMLPGYFTNPKYLAAGIVLQLLVVCLFFYERLFFPFLMIAFFWAGMELPFSEPWTMGRWVVLGAGACVGLLRAARAGVMINKRFHLVSLLCVASAVVSAIVSALPTFSLLKAFSLLLLFLYGASGARLVLRDPERFFKGLLLACEIGVYASAIAYFILHEQIWGNINSLGAIQGVVIAPLLLWGALITENKNLRLRRWIGCLGALYLVYFSVTRAALLASTVSMIFLLVALRRQKLVLRGLLGATIVIALSAIAVPSHVQDLQDSVTTGVIYKGHREQGVLGSRLTPWQETVQVIRGNPYFGSGFGTSINGDKRFGETSSGTFSSTAETNREHGSSYLAIVEWVGVVGIAPFAVLIIFLLRAIARVYTWVRQTGSAAHYSVPLMMLMVAGLTHAFFEDWLFAVGYYLTVFFWVGAFLLMDLLPAPATQRTAIAYGTPLAAAAGRAVMQP